MKEQKKKYYSVIIKMYRNVARVVAEYGRVVYSMQKPKNYRRKEKEYEGIVEWFESADEAYKLIMSFS